MKRYTLAKILCCAGLLGLSYPIIAGQSCVAQAAASQLKVGIVDLDRALQESVAGKQALQSLKQYRDKVVKEINDKKRQKDSKEAALRNLQTELTAQSTVLSEATRRDKEETYRRQLRDLRNFIDDANRFIEASERDLREREADMTSRLLGNILSVVRAVGKEEGFTIIFERNDRFLLYAADAIDLTDKIIKRFDTAKR